MRRADRLFLLTRLLNAAQGQVVTAAALAAEIEVSVRTVYRDLDDLRANGIAIDGERGVGFRLAERAVLPPLALSFDELDALVLGMRTVESAGDRALARAARTLTDKALSALPPSERRAAAEARLFSPAVPDAPPPGDLACLRRALRERRKLSFAYTDREGAASRRIVHPLALSYLGTCWVLVAWCELRRDHRVFRTDRIAGPVLLDAPVPHRPGAGDRAATAPWR